MRARDIIGILLGIPALLLGLYVWLTAIADGSIYWGTTSAALLFLSTSLFIPGRLYEQGPVRIVGFIALSVMAASVAAHVAGFGVLLRNSWQKPPGGDATWDFVLAIICGLASAFPFSGTWVLLFKLEPKPAYRGIWTAAGSAFGLFDGGAVLGITGILAGVPSILQNYRHLDEGWGAFCWFVGLGIPGAIMGAALGATMMQKVLSQKSSFWKALLGAVVGTVLPGIGTVIGAVIGSGWKAKPADPP